MYLVMYLMMFSAPGQKTEVGPQTKNLISDLHSSGQTNHEPLLTPRTITYFCLDQLQKIRGFFKLAVIVLGSRFGHINRVQRPQLNKPLEYQSHKV